MKKRLLVFILLGFLVFLNIVSAGSITINGRLVDHLTGTPITGAALSSAYEFSPSEVVTDASGNFQFTITDEFRRKEGAEAGMPDVSATYNFYSSYSACYSYAQIGILKNYESYPLALTIYGFFDKKEEAKDISKQALVNLGDIKMYPMAHLSTTNDIGASVEVQGKHKTSIDYDEWHGLGGNGDYTYEHSSTGILPLDYDVRVKFTEESEREYLSTTFHVPDDAKCKEIYLEFENGEFIWSIGPLESGGAQGVPDYIEMPINKGWNLLPVIQLKSPTEDSQIKESDFVVQYLYFTGINKYIKIWPKENDDEIMKDLQKAGINEDYLKDYMVYLLNSGTWVYSKKTGSMKADLRQWGRAVNHNTVGLKQGWNFKVISLSMKGKKFKDIKGNCSIVKIASWNSEKQKWNKLEIEEALNMEVKKEQINQVFAFKVSSDCMFSDKENLSESILINYPQEVSTYKLVGDNLEKKECNDISENERAASLSLSGEICIKNRRLEYADTNSNNGMFVILTKITKGYDLYKAYFNNYPSQATIGGYNVQRLESHELFWFISNEQAIFTQEFTKVPSEEGGFSYNYGTATGDNAVTQWFLSSYPPI